MGRTKALVEVGGRSMGNRALDALRAAGCEPLVVYGGDPVELASLDAPVWPDRFPGDGPVGAVLGVLTALADAQHDVPVTAVLVTACDLPDLDERVLDPLLRGLQSAPDRVEVVVARSDRIEPLCAVWRFSARPGLDDAFARGERALHRVLETMSVVAVDVPGGPLRNVNTPDDLE